MGRISWRSGLVVGGVGRLRGHDGGEVEVGGVGGVHECCDTGVWDGFAFERGSVKYSSGRVEEIRG